MHQICRPIAQTLGCLALLSLAACTGGGSVGGDNASSQGSGTASLPAMLLASADLGSGLLGQLAGLSFDPSASAGKFLEFEGTPWINSPSGLGHSLAFNSVDGKFYGVLSGAGAHGSGVLISFDPVTNQARMLKTLSPVTAAGETVNGVAVSFVQPGEYRMRPVVSPDGKSLMVRASQGGILDRGVLTHINLDSASGNYLKDTIVYSFFDYEKNNGGTCVALMSSPEKSTEMVLQGGAIYMGLGGLSYMPNANATDPSLRTTCNQIANGGNPQNQIPATTFALSPSDASDWSKPWVYGNPANTGRLATAGYSPYTYKMGRLAYWSNTTSALRWSTFDDAATTDYARLYNGVDPGTTLYSYAAECIAPIGWLPTDSTYGNTVVCGGGPNSFTRTFFLPSLFSQAPGGSQSLVLQAPFSSWGQSKTFIGATSSLVSRRLVVNGGDRAALVDTCFEDALFNCAATSTLEEVNPSFSYARTVLSTGDETKTGKFYFGHPAIGGGVNEPIADRYVVWFGAQLRGYSNVLNKYDRLTGQTVTLPLDPKAGAYPIGKPLDLGNGLVLGMIRKAPPVALTQGNYQGAGLGGYQGGSSYWPSVPGFYWADLRARQVTRRASPNIREASAWNLEPMRLADGTIWTAYSNNLGTPQRVIGKINVATGNIDTFKAFAESAGAPAANFALGSRAGVVYAPLWSSSTAQVIGCVRSDNAADAYQSSTVASTGASTFVVMGATDSPANAALYLPVAGATAGSIIEIDRGVADANLCKAAPALTTVAQNLPDLPSTKILALRSGALVYGTANGKLMLLDPAQAAGSRVRLLADLTAAGSTSTVKGYLSEVADGVVAAVVMDYQASRNTGRRLVQVTLATGTQASRDISGQVSEFEPYPGVSRID